ncbi:MAG: ferritin-like domain-containing protein [Bacillota bacterium]
MNDILKALAYAIEMEKQGEYFYKTNMDRVKSTKAKSIFQRLALMEKDHQKLLLKQFDELKQGKNWIDILKFKENEVDMFGAREELEHIPQSEYESELGDISIIRMAYLLENDLAEYYAKAVENTGDPMGKEMFLTLSKWEIEHRDMLYKEYKELMERNWFEMGYSPF